MEEMPRSLILALLLPWTLACSAEKREPELGPYAVAPEGPASADADFSGRVPENTRLLGRLDMALPLWHSEIWRGLDEAMSELRAAGLRVKALKECGIDRERAIGLVEFAVAEPLRVLVEVHGTLSIDALACLVGSRADDGRLVVEDITITDLPAGGLRISNYQPVASEGAPKMLRARFGSLVKRYPVVVAGSLGPGEAQVDVALVQGRTNSRLEVVLPESKDAVAAHTWLAAALNAASLKNKVLAQFKVELQDGKIVIEFPSFDEVPPGIKTSIHENLVETVQIASFNMFPTLEEGDHALVAKGPSAGNAERSDLIVFRGPDRRLYVGRVIGVGGDQIVQRSGALRLNGTAVPTQKLQGGFDVMEKWDPMTNQALTSKGVLWSETIEGHQYRVATIDGMAATLDGEWTVPEDHVFVIGDNRGYSRDSRLIGPIPKSSIVGHVVGLWFSNGPSGPRWERMGRKVP